MTFREVQKFNEEVASHLSSGAKSLCINRQQAEFVLELSRAAIDIHKAKKIAAKYLNHYGKY